MQAVSYNTYCLVKSQLMANMDLPTEFDFIVVGSGLEESIVAAALSRNGHSVLHVDFNSYYGGDWASFTFEGLQQWIETQAGPSPPDLGGDSPSSQEISEKFCKENEVFAPLEKHNAISDLRQEWFIPTLDEEEEHKLKPEESGLTASELASQSENTEEEHSEVVQEPEKKELGVDTNVSSPKSERWSRKRLLENSRYFNLDLAPRLLFSRGAMVELLISSNVSRYTEFKALTRVLTVIGDGLEHVPSSRADIFATKHISVVEKRMLMRFITACMSEDMVVEEDRNFRDFLKREKLTDNLIHYIVHSIAMVTDDANCKEGVAATRKFLSSLGRFGNTPFLWPMYGSGELPQSFCRLCAVFGGTYLLGRRVDGLVLTSDGARCSAIVVNGTRIECNRALVISGSVCPGQLKRPLSAATKIHRSIAIASSSVLSSEKEQLSFISLPPNSPSSSYTFIQEVGHGASACPKGLYCLHETSASRDSKPLGGALMPESRRDQLWSLTFDVEAEQYDNSSRVASNVYVCSGPIFELDYDKSIENSAQIFSHLCPGEEFLPRAPDPEEIIIGGTEEEEAANAESSGVACEPKETSEDQTDS